MRFDNSDPADKLQQGPGVGAMSLFAQPVIIRKIAIVIDLSIEDQFPRAIRTSQRLVRFWVEVDDGKTRAGEYPPMGALFLICVRPSPANPLRGIGGNLLNWASIEVGRTYEATH